MIYLDHGATSFPKLPQVQQAVTRAMQRCANPGRGGHRPAMAGAETVYQCRNLASQMFQCPAEQVVFTANCTQGLNIAIHTLVQPGDRVLISGFEHNAVTRPLYARNARMVVAGTKLFDWQDTLEQFEQGLRSGVSVAVFTHCSNVFGYILPVQEMAELCRHYGVPFVMDAAQSAGTLPVSLEQLGADFIAMPGHKGLLGPMGTGLLLCGRPPVPLMQGGTGSNSADYGMPDALPDALEAGTVNVPGIAGLTAGLKHLQKQGIGRIFRREQKLAAICAKELEKLGFIVFSGENQGGTVSFVGKEDCEDLAEKLSENGIAVRAGLHCAPLAHQSAGTLTTGTVRVSMGHNTTEKDLLRFLEIMGKLSEKNRKL